MWPPGSSQCTICTGFGHTAFYCANLSPYASTVHNCANCGGSKHHEGQCTSCQRPSSPSLPVHDDKLTEVCVNCSGRGHYGKQCFSSTPVAPSDTVCTMCHGYGHLDPACPNPCMKTPVMESPPDSSGDNSGDEDTTGEKSDTTDSELGKYPSTHETPPSDLSTCFHGHWCLTTYTIYHMTSNADCLIRVTPLYPPVSIIPPGSTTPVTCSYSGTAVLQGIGLVVTLLDVLLVPVSNSFNLISAPAICAYDDDIQIHTDSCTAQIELPYQHGDGMICYTIGLRCTVSSNSGLYTTNLYQPSEFDHPDNDLPDDLVPGTLHHDGEP